MPKRRKRKFLGARPKYFFKQKPSVIDHDFVPSDQLSVIDPIPMENEESVLPVVQHHEHDYTSMANESSPSLIDNYSSSASVDHNYSTASMANESPPSVIDNDSSSASEYICESFLSVVDHDYAMSSMVKEPEHLSIIDSLEDGSPPDNKDSTFEKLEEDVRIGLCSPYVSLFREDRIEIVELYKVEGKTSVKLAINIDRTYKATVYVHRKELPADHDLWNSLPRLFDSHTKVLQLLNRLQKFVVCIGNPDEDFQDLTPIGCGLSANNVPGILAYREGDFSAHLGNFAYNSSIRSVDCVMLVEGRRCNSCAMYRRSLWNRKHRLADKSEHSAKDLVHSHYKHRDMDRQMLIAKIAQQQSCIKTLQHTVDRQRRDFDRQILQSGIIVPDHQNQEMSDLLTVCRDDIEKAFPDPNSLQRLFWDQQIKFAKSGKNGMRWHPMIIKWCLYLRHKSSKAYNILRDSGFVKLPSERTLFDYSHYIKSALGFQGDVIKMLHEEASKKGMLSSDEPYKCYVGILFDEIKIKEDLVYDKHTGELVGYCNLDEIGNQILELQKMSDNAMRSTTAKYMLVLMVRGVSTDLKFPLAGFATTSITADFLYPIIWKAVDAVETIHLKVLFFTCDGASPNRKFFNLHKVSEDQVLVYSTVNPRDKSRKIFFISDVPHLVKTTRNCFSNSYSHKNTRKLWKDGKDISWLHILKLYEEHCETAIYNPCPKLSRTHVDMTSFGCMKVNLAAQVLSSSVANALEDLYDDDVSETVDFIRNFNKFFDCLNVRSLYEGRNKRNPDMHPYKDVADPRLEWLKTDFLGYLDSWNVGVDNRPGNFTQTQRNGMKLSKQTIQGLKISINSITECVKLMLDVGANFVLTHHFNQDPIEQHFGHYRHRGGNNANPTVYEVRNMMTEMRTIGAQALVPRNGNIRRGNEENMRPPIDNTRLPKRKSNR